jgi:uncharacterized membrane protein YfbV (UPF0208 family)
MVMGNTVATVLTLAALPLALAGLYFAGVRAVLWIAEATR